MTQQEIEPDSLALLKEQQVVAAAHPEDVEAIRALGDAHFDCSLWEDAISTYREALVMDATDSDLHNALGEACEMANDPGAAERSYREAIALKPSNSTAYFNLGSLCEDQRRTPEAIQAFEQCLQHSTETGERSAVTEKLTRLFPERKDVVDMYKRFGQVNTGFLVAGGLFLLPPASVLEQVWGIALLVLVILARKIRVPALFVVYAAPWAWLGVLYGESAFLTGQMWKLALALVQFVVAIILLRNYAKYTTLHLHDLHGAGAWPAGIAPPQEESEILNRFAAVSAILAGASLILVPTVIAGAAVLAIVAKSSPLAQLAFPANLGVVHMAVISIGLGCAALLARTSRKALAAGGVFLSGMVVAGWQVLQFVMAAIH
jgi:tetratricopeptide (TPR) repeat protein